MTFQSGRNNHLLAQSQQCVKSVPEQCVKSVQSVVIIVNSEQISHIVLVFLLLTLNK